ncbi:hypothetical protein CRM90_02575 [Mycobacterium sp. ENV421]|nr:hypothetical protein CRM90_02575 [Mycobacterium sp. ENV421]
MTAVAAGTPAPSTRAYAQRRLRRLTGVATCRCPGSRRTRCLSTWDGPSCSRRTMRRRPRSCSSTHRPARP